jgi:flagellar P-ring protein precursor FlgI
MRNSKLGSWFAMVSNCAAGSKFALALALLLVVGSLGSPVQAARVKDMATLQGAEEQHLIGYGLVVGLAGTGDGTQAKFTTQSVINMLRNMGIEVPDDRVRMRNVAAVMVTATLKPFQKAGSRVDVSVSSIGDARSLEGGTLLMAPMQGVDGEQYAMAQGPLTVGGFAAVSATGKSSSKRNHLLAGSIPDGALIERQLAPTALLQGELFWQLRDPDFTSAVAMATAINGAVGGEVAQALDASSVRVTIPQDQKKNLMPFIAKAEAADFAPATVARVVLNEKTGTIVSGTDVRIGEVAVAHGNITIDISGKDSTTQVQTRNARMTSRQTSENLEVQEPKTEVKVMPAIQNAGQLAAALNGLGVTPRDIISIFQAIKRAGALQAELVVM